MEGANSRGVWTFDDFPLKVDFVKARIYTNFCKTCSKFNKHYCDCVYMRQTAFRVLLDDASIEREVNEFACPYNAERLIYGEDKRTTG